jgi:acyl-CoA synthetase (AMP-forming)/AMP-acid ligase II
VSHPPSLRLRLEAAFSGRSQEVAIIDENGRDTTCAELTRRIDELTTGLASAGMCAGDHVLFAVRPSAEAIALLCACLDLGAVIVAAPLGAGDVVFASQMRLADPAWVIAESGLLMAMHMGLMRRLVRLRGGNLPAMPKGTGATLVRTGRWLPGTRAVSLARLVARGRRKVAAKPGALDAEAAAFIVFTSGTTAAPKAVVHSRRSMEATLAIVTGQLRIEEHDVLLARDAHLILPALFARARVVMPRHGVFSPSGTLATMRKHEVTHMFEVTANCRALADHADASGERLPSSLRHLLIGAAPVRAAFLQRIASVLPRATIAWCTYGMTEMIPVSAVSLHEKLGFEGEGDLVGAPVPGASARIGDGGELFLCGANLFTGYLGQPPVTELATGDVARLDAGRIVLHGRMKDMIVRREHNIYPELHESVIERIPGVKRCAMVGFYDEALHDERIALAVEAEDGAGSDALRGSIERAMRSGPTRIDVSALPDHVFFIALPLSGRALKVDKIALREMAHARFG